ncbi:MAG TPA: hypothetical protein VFT04_01470 [Gemmatimonadales bacterium]|nr:hypothetical protein [Gemmatimonadales bacterium]
MKRGYRVAGLSLMLAAAFACGSDDPDDGRCGEEVLNFSVTPGINPSISWAPSCTIAQLRINRNEEGNPEIWAFVASSNSVLPAVTYGQTPIGATETNPPETLIFDATYTITVAVEDPESGLLLVVGSTEFTPTL